jgi:hypothetical protein
MKLIAAPARLALLMMAAGAVLAACAAPSGQTETVQEKCAVCILENPGDGPPCYPICMQSDEGRVEYQRKYVGQ